MPSTLLPEPPRPRLHRGRVRHPARVRLALIFLRLAIALILGGFAVGGWYLAKKGFSRKVTRLPRNCTSAGSKLQSDGSRSIPSAV